MVRCLPNELGNMSPLQKVGIGVKILVRKPVLLIKKVISFYFHLAIVEQSISLVKYQKYRLLREINPSRIGSSVVYGRRHYG